MRWRDAIKELFGGARRMIDEAEQHATAAVDAAEREAASPAPGATVTTRREEVRPDGTRVVTTVTRTHVVTRERKA